MSKFNFNKEEYSLNDVLKEDAEFLDDKIFEIQYKHSKQPKKFKYVQIKVSVVDRINISDEVVQNVEKKLLV